MKANRKFVTLLAILLLVVVGGILIALMIIADRGKGIIDDFGGNATQLMWTNEYIATAIHATETAKAYTETPTKQP